MTVTSTDYPSGAVISSTTTETTVETDNDGCSGILSCTVDFLGDVIAFPFRLMGGAVKAIF